MSNKAFYTPVRPPRGSKVSKDTSGRLMNIIAELSVSKNNEDRKRKMLELKKDFLASDGRLIQLISGHRDQLSITMEKFTLISAKIDTSRRGCRDVKEKLVACKTLLACKRDEIRRLWLESVEHREVITMLQEIEALNHVHHQVEKHLAEKEFLKGTELLVSSLALLDGKLADADGLKDLKIDLKTLSKKLHHLLVKELNHCLYMTPSEDFITTVSHTNKSYEDVFTLQRKQYIKLPTVDGSFYDLTSNFSYEHIAITLNAISLLKTLPGAVEVLKDNCSKELMTIVRNSTEAMLDILENSSYPKTCTNDCLFLCDSENHQEKHLLLDLFEVILHQFRHVAINHYSFVDNIERISMTKGLTEDNTVHYEIADIYSKLSAAIEIFIGDYYMDLHSSAATQRAAAAFAKVPTHSFDISQFFLRKNVTRTRYSLFKFDGSSHAINKKTYLQEQKDTLKEKGELDSERSAPFLVCEPAVKNITVVYKSLRKFIGDIEVALKMEPGTHCPLHTFLMDCVKVYLDEVNIEISRLIERTTLTLEAWQAVTHADIEELKSADTKTEILSSTVLINDSLKEMEALICSLPDFSSHFLQLMCHVLEVYKDLCHSSYKSLIYPDSDEQQIFSVSWIKDQDISRLLRSLPNWINLSRDSNKIHDYEESPEEIRFRNKEESELLIRNLSSKDSISLKQIISEPNKLKNLALMHESMEWLSLKILAFAERLPDVEDSLERSTPEKFNEDIYGNSEVVCSGVGISTKVSLKKLAEDFEDLADHCLLVLHLEVRAHCFYYLLQLSKQGSYVNRKDEEEPEPEILKLNSDLSKIDESLSPVLQPKKIRYIFEGIGELLSTILINGVSNIKKINENGVKKMGRNIFAIQQNLAGITMTREVALDRARQYFDLLNHTYEDILNQIVEEGPQFQEHEYSAVIQLLHNSREGIYEQDSLTSYLEKLRQILDEVAVSI